MSDLIGRSALFAKKIPDKFTVEHVLVSDIEEAPAVDAFPKWINIKEKLPERGKKVLVVNGHGYIDMLAFWQKESNKWTWLDSSGHFNHINDIGYWMPLPELPKGE